MAIKRAKRETNFTIMSNVGLRDERLSWKARGLLAYMLSLPDDWVFYETELVKRAPDGLSGVRSGLKELEEHGFLVRVRERDENGRLKGSDWIIHDEPICDYPTLDKPILEKPTLDKPILENRTLLSTNCTKDLKELSTNSTNNNNNKAVLKENESENVPGEKQKEKTNGDVHLFYQQNFGVETPFIGEDLEYWINDLSAETVILALQKAIEMDAPYAYSKKIMNDWANLEIKTVEEAKSQILSHSKKNQQRKNYNQSYKQAQKKEVLPDWADQEQPKEETLLDEEAQRKFDERLKKFRKGSAAGETR